MDRAQLQLADQSGVFSTPGRTIRKVEGILEPSTIRRHVRDNTSNLLRFVNVLAGNQRFANLCIVKLIDSVVQKPSILLSAGSPKAALYQHMISIIRDAVTDDNCPVWRKAVEPQRLAYLLSELDGFSLGEVAQMLNTSPDSIQVLLSNLAFGERLTPAARILVIEDDPLISWQIERLVAQLGHQLVGIATTRRQATKYFGVDLPDIIIADVQLADGSTGVESVADVFRRNPIPVLFVTADPDALQPKQFSETTFVVSKPFKPGALKAMISQAVYLSELQRRRMPVALAKSNPELS